MRCRHYEVWWDTPCTMPYMFGSRAAAETATNHLILHRAQRPGEQTSSGGLSLASPILPGMLSHAPVKDACVFLIGCWFLTFSRSQFFWSGDLARFCRGFACFCARCLGALLVFMFGFPALWLLSCLSPASACKQETWKVPGTTQENKQGFNTTSRKQAVAKTKKQRTTKVSRKPKC